MTLTPVKDSGSLLTIACPAHFFTFLDHFQLARMTKENLHKKQLFSDIVAFSVCCISFGLLPCSLICRIVTFG